MEKRLTDFAITVLFLIKDLKNCYEARYLGQQIIRSGTSTPLNFGEAKSSESRKDFIHKSAIVLKELRETYINLNILEKARLHTISVSMMRDTFIYESSVIPEVASTRTSGFRWTT